MTSVAVHHTHRTYVGVCQHTQDVRGCLWLSVSTHRTFVAVRVCPSVSVCVRQHTQDVRGCPSIHISARCIDRTFVCVRQHTGRLCVSVSTHKTSVAVCVYPCVSISTHRTSVAVHQLSVQYTQNVRGCLPAHIGRLWLSVCVRVCPSAHTGRPWLSISTHISTLVLGLSTLALPVDCSGDFGPRGLSVQYTQDVRGCSSAHTGRLCVSVRTHMKFMAVCMCPCVSVSTHRTSVAVHHRHRTSVGVPHHTQDVPVCLCLSVCTHKTSVAVHQYTYQNAGPWTQHAGPSPGLFGAHRMSVAVHQRTQDVCGCPTHISTLVLGLNTLVLPVDCSGDFGPRGLPVQYTQDIHGCSSAHTGRPCVSVSTHRTFVAVCMCSCVSVSTHRTSVAVHHTHRTNVGVPQHTQDVRVCSTAHIGHLWLSISTHISMLVLGLSTLALPVECSGDFGPCGLSVQYTQDIPHTGRLWLSISTHISTLVLGLSTLALPVDCSGDFSPRGLSVQYTQDVRGCSIHRTSVAVRLCPCVSVSIHRTSTAVHQYTYQHTGPWTQHAGPWTQHADPSRGLLGTHRTSLGVRQHTHDVRVCPSAHAGRPTLVLGLSTLTLPVDCSGDFGPRRLSVQYTQDVRGCPPAHISACCTHKTFVDVRQHTHDVCGCPCVYVSTHRTSVAVRVCPCVSVSIHRTSVAVHLYTYQQLGPWTQHADPSRGLFGTLTLPVDCSGDFGPRGLSAQYTQDVCDCPTHISTLVLGLSTLALPVDSSGDFGPRGLSVQYTQAVRGCPKFVLELSTLTLPMDCSGDFGPRGLSVQYTLDVSGCPPAHTGRPTLALPVNCSGDFGPRGLSVQYTQDVSGCLSAHTKRLWLSVCVHVCPSAHKGRLYLSISTHISMLVLGLNTLTLPVDCSGDFGPREMSAQYTQDVRGCPSAHTGRPWLSVCVRQHTQDVLHRTSVGVSQHTHDVSVCPSAHTGRPWLSVCVRQHTQDVCGCPCVSVSTHRTSVAVLVCPSAHTGRPWLFVCVRVCLSEHPGRPWLSISTHISTVVLGLSTLTLPVDCSGDFSPRGLSVQYTQDVLGCLLLSVSIHRTSVAFRVCPSAHTGHPWLSISTHISTLVLGLSTLALPVDCLGDLAHVACLFSTHRTSVGVHQHTQNVCGCPSAHTERPCLSVCVRVCPCVSVCVCQHTHDVHGCPSLHILARWSLVSACWPFLWTVRVILAHVGCLFSTHRTSVGVRQHTQDVRVCPSAQTGRSGLSVCVRVCPCVSVSTHRTSVAVHQYTYQHVGLGLSTLTLPVDCSYDFDPCGQSVQYTQDVRGCQSAHTGRLWLSVCVRVWPCVSVSTHRNSVAVHQYTYQHAGPWTQHAGPSRGHFG
ncbi:hypothetical protein YC2023_066229 [Brassica napus]